MNDEIFQSENRLSVPGGRALPRTGFRESSSRSTESTKPGLDL